MKNKEIEELKKEIENLKKKYEYLEYKDMKSYIELYTETHCKIVEKTYTLNYINKIDKEKTQREIYFERIFIGERHKIPVPEILKEDDSKVYIKIKHYLVANEERICNPQDNEYIIFNKISGTCALYNENQINDFIELKEFKDETKNKQVSKTRKKPKVNFN